MHKLGAAEMGSTASVIIPDNSAMKEVRTAVVCDEKGMKKMNSTSTYTSSSTALNISDNTEVRRYDNTRSFISHEEFIFKVKQNWISCHDAETYITKYPECLEIVDINYQNVLIQYAGNNRNTELFCLLMRHKVQHMRTPLHSQQQHEL